MGLPMKKERCFRGLQARVFHASADRKMPPPLDYFRIGHYSPTTPVGHTFRHSDALSS